MKKGLILFSAVIGVLLLTGCSSSGPKLICVQRPTDGVEVKMISEFNSEEMTFYGMEYNMDMNSYTDEQVKYMETQDMCALVKASIPTYANAFTNCKYNISDKKFNLTAEFELNKLTEGITKKTTIDLVKTELEKQGYTCVSTD